ncbi:MAG: ABC transporter ATP-binding protein, partial [Acidobacteriota bacterium]
MPERFQPLFRLIRRVQVPWLLLGCACVLTLIETGIALWVPLLTRDLIDSATSGAISQRLVGMLVGILLVEAVFSALGIYLLARAAAQLTAFLRRRVVAHLLRLPMAFHDEQRSGELVSRTLSDTESIEDLLTQQIVYCISSLLSIVGAITILWFLDWRLTLVLFGSALLGLLLVLPVAAKLQGIGKEIQDRQADFSGRLAGVLADMRLLKASCAEDEESGRAGGSIESLRGLALREARIYAVLGPTVTLGVSGAMVVILGYGGARVASGALAVGTLVAFILYLFQVVMPMVQFSTFVAALNKAAGAAEHLSGLLDEEEEDAVRSGDDASGAFRGDLIFDGIRHSYGETEVLRDVDLRIPAGKVTALVGPSGGGKTTILSLLERFYAPSHGRLVLGDREASAFELESWRRSIGYVTQEAPLLAGTVRENLCFGLEATPAEDA